MNRKLPPHLGKSEIVVMDAIPFIFPGPILSFLFFCVPQVTHFALLADQTDFLAFSSSSFLSRGLTRRRVL